MTQVKDAKDRLIWKALQSNAKGQLTKIKRGNIESTSEFDDRGFLVSMTTPNIVNMEFSFENDGNLDYRTDKITGLKEIFSYDNLDRLASWSTSRNNTVLKTDNITYNPTGTISTMSALEGYNLMYAEGNNKPDALTSIQGAPACISADSLIIGYTDFKKVKTLSEENKLYNIIYGVDQQRKLSVYTKGGVSKITRYYLGNYEEEINATGKIRKIHYLPGGCVYIENEKDSLLNTYTDYQGNLLAVTDENGKVLERHSFDPWGNRRNPENWSQKDTRTSWILNRGYTMHEHLDEFGVINMNGRIYDPLTASFFSPDPFIQAPDNWLNYNRYLYCYGNPLKFTDPNGEFVWWLVPVVAAAVFATGNTVAHAIRGDIHNFWDGLKFFGQGAITGFALACAWQFAPLIPAVGGAIQGVMTAYAASQVSIGVTGMALGLIHGGKGLGNGAKAFLGNFYLDENNWLGGIAQGFLRHTWEVIQTTIGQLYTQVKNASGDVDRVDYLGGGTFATKENDKENDGITFGNYININISKKITGNFDDYVKESPLYMHEYGHTIDSRAFGISYLFVIGIPSGLSALKSQPLSSGLTTHKVYWTETRANKRAAKYFNKYYGIEWNFPSFPFSNPFSSN